MKAFNLPTTSIQAFRKQLRQPYYRYLLLVTVIGWAIAVWSVKETITLTPGSYLPIFLLLAIVAGITTVDIKLPHEKISYSVAPTISMAVMLISGLWAAAVVENVSMIALWLFRTRDGERSFKSLERLLFNGGTSSVSICCAGAFFLAWKMFVANGSPILYAVGVGIAAIVFDQVNLWLVLVIVALKDRTAPPLAMWRAGRVTSLLNIVILAVVGGALAYVGLQFDWMGMAAFSAPLLLISSFL